MTSEVEERRNQLNHEIRGLIALLDLIEGKNTQTENYISNSLNELDFLKKQINLANEAKTRLMNIFKN